MVDEPIRHVDYFDLRHGQTKPQAKARCKKLAGESAGAEWVVLELDGIQAAVRRLHEVGLGSAVQSADVLDCRQRKPGASELRPWNRPGKVNISHVLPAPCRLNAVRARSVLATPGVARWLAV